MPLLGTAAWAGALLGAAGPRWLAVPLAAVLVLALVACRRRRAVLPLLLGVGLALLSAVTVTGVRQEQVVHLSLIHISEPTRPY